MWWIISIIYIIIGIVSGSYLSALFDDDEASVGLMVAAILFWPIIDVIVGMLISTALLRQYFSKSAEKLRNYIDERLE